MNTYITFSDPEIERVRDEAFQRQGGEKKLVFASLRSCPTTQQPELNNEKR
jgi:hypothetical protein